MKKLIYLIIFAGLFFTSCNKNKSAIDVTGIVVLKDQYSQMLPSDGVEVTISLNDKKGQPITTTTDEKGIYLFKDIPMGTYDFTFKKENHPEIPLYSIQILGHGELCTLGTTTISQIPTITATLSDSISDFFGWQGIKVKFNNYNTSKGMTIYAYLSTENNVSKEEYDKKIYINDFIDSYYFNSGTTYLVVYAHSYYGYYDENKNYVNPYEIPISKVIKIEK